MTGPDLESLYPCAIDTNLLVYCIDALGGERSARARALLAALDPSRTSLPWQVLVELGRVGVRFDTDGRAAVDVLAFIEGLVGVFPIVRSEASAVTQAITLSRTQTIHYWDALIVAACAQAGIATLLSEDLPGRVGASLLGVRVVNPLAVS